MTTAKVSDRGRITLPSFVRRALGLRSSTPRPLKRPFSRGGSHMDQGLSRPCKTPAPRMNAHFVVFFGAPNPLRNVMVEAIF